LRFVNAKGIALPPDSPRPNGDWRKLPAGEAVMKWRGERMDYGQAIDVLLQQAKRGNNVPAGTSRTG
jgi:hypothetical protein